MQNFISETERLRLELCVLSDHAFIFELLNSSGWIQYIGDRNIKSKQDAEAYIQNSILDHQAKLGFSLYKMVLKSTNQAIGLCGLLKRDFFDFPDLGFAILPGFSSKGYTKEASLSIIQLAKNDLGYKKLLAFTGEQNIGSQKLLESLGFKLIEKRMFESYEDESLIYEILE